MPCPQRKLFADVLKQNEFCLEIINDEKKLNCKNNEYRLPKV